MADLEFQSIPARRELIEETMKVVDGASSHEPGSSYRRLWARHLPIISTVRELIKELD